MEWMNMDVLRILQIGVIGLGFLLAVLAYFLLAKEQKQKTPRTDILKSIYVFMSFSLLLCLLGIASQAVDITRASPSSSPALPPPAIKSDETLYNYFVYSDDAQDIELCNISEFVYSEASIDTENMSIEGKITGKLTVDNKLVDFEHPAYGNKNKYYLKIIHDDGVAFLERKGGDYAGYWIGEVDDPDLSAVVCPLVFSPDAKGLSAEEARSKWSILNEPCRALFSLSEIITAEK
ncbi:MAG: hypothetical protein ABW092_16200 [Candidatus Thiodiazotropha sp.]